MIRFLYGLPYPADEAHWHDGKTMLPHAEVYTVAENYGVENLKAQVHKNMLKLIRYSGDKPDLIQTIREIIKRFENGHLADTKKPGRTREVVVEANLHRASELIAKNPKSSV